MNEALRNLLERRSVRTYQSRQLSDADLDAILEAGTYAPSAMGKQPALMAVVQDPALIAQLSRMNAQFTDDPTSDPFYGAPSVILVFADTARPTWIQDGSLVMGNLMNAAHAVGVGSCWINRAFQMFSTDEGKALKEKLGRRRIVLRHRLLHPRLLRRAPARAQAEKRRLCHPRLKRQTQNERPSGARFYADVASAARPLPFTRRTARSFYISAAFPDNKSRRRTVR